MYRFSELTIQSRKSKKTYTTAESDWVCYWHFLSGDELPKQVITIAHKPTDFVYSFTFPEVSNIYKFGEVVELEKNIATIFNVKDIKEAVDSILKFLDDAKLEYTNKPFFLNEIVK